VSAPGRLEGVSAQIETATPPLDHPPVLDDGEPHAEAGAQLGLPLGGGQGSGRQDRDDPADSAPDDQGRERQIGLDRIAKVRRSAELWGRAQDSGSGH